MSITPTETLEEAYDTARLYSPRSGAGRALATDGLKQKALDLATAPLADIAADEKARREAEKPPLKNFAEAFERMAEHAVNNLTDDEQDMAVDMVAALTPHLEKEVSAMYFEDLMTAVVALGKAEDGEHPGDVDELTWVEQCRDAVEFAANKLAGVA